MKKAIIITVSVIVVLAAAFAGLFFFTDTFNFLKPASDNFAKQAKKIMGADEDPKYADYEEFLNKLKSDSSSTAELNMSMNLNLPSSAMSSSTQKLINSSSVKYKGSYDANSKALLNDIGLYKDNKEVLTMSILTKDQSVSITSKDLYDKYLTLDMSKYEQFCKDNNIPDDEETKKSIESLSKLKDVDSAKLAYDLYYISEKDYNALHKNYDNILVDLIDKENYTTKKNQKVSVDGDEVKTTAYSLTMDGKDAVDFANKLIDKVKGDSTLKNLLIEKYNLMKKYGNTVAAASDEIKTELPELKDSDIDEFLSELVKEFEKSKDQITDEQSIKITIYSNKKNEPVKLEIAVLKDKKDEGSVIFTEELAKGKNIYTIDMKKLSELTSNDSDNSDDSNTFDLDSLSSSKSISTTSATARTTPGENARTTPGENARSSSIASATKGLSSLSNGLDKIIIVDSYEKTDDSRKGTIKVSAKASDEKQEMLEIKYDTVNSKSESKFDVSISSPLSSSISLNFVSEVTGLDSDTQKMKLSVDGKFSMYSVKFAMDGTNTLKAEVPELNSSNSIDVFTKSKEELQTIFTEIVTKAAEVLPTKLAPYGVNINKNQILSTIPTNTTTPSETTTTPDTTTTTTTTPSGTLTEAQKKQLEQSIQQADSLLNNSSAYLTEAQKQQLIKAKEQAQKALQQQ